MAFELRDLFDGPQVVGRAGASGNLRYWQQVINLYGLSSIVTYPPLLELSGATAYDKSPNGINVAYSGAMTLGGITSPGGQPAPLIPGNGGKVNFYSAAFQTAFPFKEGAFPIWFKVTNEADWTDGVSRYLYLLYTDSNNRLFARTNTVGNRMDVYYTAGSVAKYVSLLYLESTEWQLLIPSWSDQGDRFEVFLNGKLAGSQTGIGTWAGSTLSSQSCLLGADNINGTVTWGGSYADPLLLNRPIASEAEALQAYQLASGYRRKTVSILGDSISDGAGDWPYLFNRKYNRGAADIINHAVGGNGIMIHMDAQVAAAANDNADLIIIFMGTNDSNDGDMTALQVKVASNLAALKVSNPRAQICYVNVLPRWTDVTGSTPMDKSNIRGAISAACAAQVVTCFDTFTDPWINVGDTSDGTHPIGATGGRKISDRLLALL